MSIYSPKTKRGVAEPDGHQHETILIIADISGYTRFVQQHRESWAHGQFIVTALIETLIQQIEIPLKVAKLEGDAIFLYASRHELEEDNQKNWDDVCARIGPQLLSFLGAFAEKLAELHAANFCSCAACSQLDQLRLKCVVHYGDVLFYRVAQFQELSGEDVILLHRLLKNKVKFDEYILLTAAARARIDLPSACELTRHSERFGARKIDVYVLQTHTAQKRLTVAPRVSSWRKFVDIMGKIVYNRATQFRLLTPRAFKELPEYRAEETPATANCQRTH